MAGDGTLGTVRNAALLLDLLSQGPPHQQLTDLAERSGLSLPTVHRLLRSLCQAGLVEQDPDSSRYGLGPDLVRLSERYLARLPVLRAVSPYLVELRNTTAATIEVAILVQGWVACVDRIDAGDSEGVFRNAPRLRRPLGTALGHVLLGRAGPAAWRWLRSSAEPHADLPSEQELRRWAKASYLVVKDPIRRRVEVAVPLQTGASRSPAALAASGDPAALTEERLVQHVTPQLLRAASAVAHAIGHE